MTRQNAIPVHAAAPSTARRRFIRQGGLLAFGLSTGTLSFPSIIRADAPLRVVSNPGLENATLTALMREQGFLQRFGVDAVMVDVDGVAGPFDAIAQGAADVCMVSGYNMVLPRIAQGAKVKVIGAGMRKIALTVFANRDTVGTLDDLEGKTVAVGPPEGLLHTLMLQLLKVKGIDAGRIHFVDKGSNDHCYAAVARGEADACCASISHLNRADGPIAIDAAAMWQALPDCIFQTAYAANAIIEQQQSRLIPLMAAYGALYDYVMHDAFFAARKRAQHRFDSRSAQAIWHFYQTARPYDKDLTLTQENIAYLQRMFIDQRHMATMLPFADTADMSAAQAAARQLG
ncbi:ABC transporter substrate-binding protein [Robbsia sp. KACC 23696]|uniref:ABC transporter substrate-binding protein n=1 Tax=Robbsia sp. KACC 23696 TaxID=3149231 RepID=UPI00325A65D8